MIVNKSCVRLYLLLLYLLVYTTMGKPCLKIKIKEEGPAQCSLFCARSHLYLNSCMWLMMAQSEQRI
jgi:hypothetical protein